MADLTERFEKLEANIYMHRLRCALDAAMMELENKKKAKELASL